MLVLKVSLVLKTTFTRSRSHLGIDRTFYSILSRTKRTLDFNEESPRKPDTSVGLIEKKVFLYNSPLNAFHHFIKTFLLVHSYIHTNMAKRWIKSCLFVIWISWDETWSQYTLVLVVTCSRISCNTVVRLCFSYFFIEKVDEFVFSACLQALDHLRSADFNNLPLKFASENVIKWRVEFLTKSLKWWYFELPSFLKNFTVNVGVVKAKAAHWRPTARFFELLIAPLWGWRCECAASRSAGCPIRLLIKIAVLQSWQGFLQKPPAGHTFDFCLRVSLQFI